MKSQRNQPATRLHRWCLIALLLALAGQMLGCEVDSFFDPSKTGRFEFTATSIPVMERIDVIEEGEDFWGDTTSVAREDLIPSDLSYRMVPGDVITVEMFELYAQGLWTTSTRRIDAAGNFRLPELGDVRAAGLTAQEFEDQIVYLLERDFMENPLVNVVVEEGSAFKYTVYGSVSTPGVFTLRDPDLRLLDVLAISGPVPLSTRSIYVIRQVLLTEEVKRPWERGAEAPPAGAPPSRQPAEQPVDVEELIEQLDEQESGGVSPGVLGQDEPTIDIDELEPVRVTEQPQVDVEDVAGQRRWEPGEPAEEDAFIYVEERGEWVRVRGEPETPAQPTAPEGEGEGEEQPEFILERIIKIPYDRLSRGDSSYNIVIRPNDRIYVETPEQGVVYIDGEINRPGVYQLPPLGRLTLSRLVAAAGGPGPLAIPERIDLTRIVGQGREATVRLNLAAIRNRTEPDLYLKRDDHVIIGTSWIATPLAIIRSGFRATYGFGFLLDRNFGNDVFGAPPVNYGNR